jgi:hypothetical protein
MGIPHDVEIFWSQIVLCFETLKNMANAKKFMTVFVTILPYAVWW